MSSLKQENDNLLKFILNERFFKPWKTQIDFNEKNLINETRLELYITSKCNQNCEYCYLTKYSDKLYPPEANKEDLILNNLKLILNWIMENDFRIPTIDLYTGEIWHSNFGLQILDILLEAVRNGLSTKFFTIPSNCSFLRNTRQRNLIQRYINLFNKEGVRLNFSVSVDGKIVEDESRPTVNKNDVKDDEFYEQMFLFAKHNNFYFHPMVSSSNIYKWKENYLWWKENLEKYDFPLGAIMMLEVRNADWTEETIQLYNEFMDFLLEDFLKKYSYIDLANMVIKEYACQPEQDDYFGYVPFFLGEAEESPTCSVADHLTIRLGDLAICPCHRTAYNKYLYGKFVVENNKIVDISAINTQMAIRILFANNKTASFGCDNCIFSEYCIKGCFGSQLENTKDPFIPIQSVCNFFQKKYSHLVLKYEELGVFDYLKTKTPYDIGFLSAQSLLRLRKEVLKNEMGKI